MNELINNILADYKCARPIPPHAVRMKQVIQLRVYDGMTRTSIESALHAACGSMCVDGFTQERNGVRYPDAGYTAYPIVVYYWVQPSTWVRASARATINRRLLPWARRDRYEV